MACCPLNVSPPIRNRENALAHERTIAEYIDTLAQRGVETLQTSAMTLKAKNGWTVLYLFQPLMEPARIGPEYFRLLSAEEVHEKFALLLDVIRGAVCDEVAPDGQLSNWVFLDEGPCYIDVSTPFMRNPDGRMTMDLASIYESVSGGIMRPFRPYFKKKMPDVFDSYFSVRGQLIDLLGNLRKEKLDNLIVPLMRQANEHLALDPPITMEEVKAYYNEDAAVYGLLMRLHHLNRWFYRVVMRRTYPNFIPPKIDRNKF